MKKILVFASLALLALVGCFMNYTHREDQTATETYKASLYTKVILETENGKIEATAVPGDSSIKVVLTRWATGFSKSDALEHLTDIKVNVDEDTTSKVLRIVVSIPDLTAYSLGCDAVITLPESLYVDLETSNGKITAGGHKNGLKLRTSNGAIELSQTAGDASLETSNGAIYVYTHTGNIEGETSNGAIDADVIMPVADGICKFSSSNGAIELAVPDSVGATIWLETSNGSITISGFELGDHNPDNNIFESTIGDESGTIDLRTSNGAVTFKKL